MGAKEAEELVNVLREQCLRKGLTGIKGISILFRGMDRDFSKRVCYQEFQEGLKRYGIIMAEDEFRLLFGHFDKDKSGQIDFREFLMELRPPMTKRRRDVVNQVFDKLDVIKDDVLKVEDLQIVYRDHAKKHPKFQSGHWSLTDVYQALLDSFDSKENKDGVVTREEFLQYYSGVSATIDDDNFFEMSMRTVWGLSPLPGRKSCVKT